MSKHLNYISMCSFICVFHLKTPFFGVSTFIPILCYPYFNTLLFPWGFFHVDTSFSPSCAYIYIFVLYCPWIYSTLNSLTHSLTKLSPTWSRITRPLLNWQVWLGLSRYNILFLFKWLFFPSIDGMTYHIPLESWKINLSNGILHIWFLRIDH